MGVSVGARSRHSHKSEAQGDYIGTVYTRVTHRSSLHRSHGEGQRRTGTGEDDDACGHDNLTAEAVGQGTTQQLHGGVAPKEAALNDSLKPRTFTGARQRGWAVGKWSE